MKPRTRAGTWTALLSALAFSGAGASSSAPPKAEDVQEVVLDNGFRLLVARDARVPRVATSLWYRVGSTAEAQGEHGSAHFLEHVVHQGTTTVGTIDFGAERSLLRQIYETEQELLAAWNRERSRLREREVFYDEMVWPTTPEIDRLRERLYELEDQDSRYREFWAEYNWYQRYGALMRHTDPVPATTFKEQIEIDIDLPREHLELFFRLEADRMVNAVLRGWEAQRFTVLEQRLGRQGRPATRFDYEALDGVSFLSHPLSHPAGGHLRDFAHFNRSAMEVLYERHFVPNNATLALVGDVHPDEVRSLAERYFGRIARGAEPPARMDMEAEPVPGGAIRLDWQEPLSPQVIVRFRIPGMGHADRPVFDAIAAILRERRDLAIGGREIDLRVSMPRVSAPYPMTLSAQAPRDDDLAALEHLVLGAVEDLRRGRIDPKVFQRARKAMRLDWEQVRSERGGLAHLLGQFQVADDWKSLGPFMEARERASVEDVQRVAQRYLVPANRILATARRNPRGTS
jgi:predicted Zn-dependent peptidase